MKRRAVIVAPGRGTYNREELGYLARHHGARKQLIDTFDAHRRKSGQTTLSALDQAERFTPSHHTISGNASPLIFACSYADFLSIDRERFEILAITGNSMGWYTALTLAGALAPMDGFDLVNTMGTLMQEKGVGGQIVYPFTDDDWRPVAGRRAEIEAKIGEINAREGHYLALSIDLGGMLVLAGDAAGLRAFEAAMPKIGDRFPMRLANHAAFHTPLQRPVAELARRQLTADLFRQPEHPLIDGRGAIWWPKSTDRGALWNYTLGPQVTEAYDFAAAIRVAAREFMPDCFIVLGPGTTLSGAVAQSLVAAEWRGIAGKSDFTAAQTETARLLAMGISAQRREVV